MDDHSWPSLYPGIIAGALLGLSRGGLLSTLAGAAGGLGGGAVTYFVVGRLGVQNDILSLALLVASAMIAAYLCERAAARLALPVKIATASARANHCLQQAAANPDCSELRRRRCGTMP